MKEEYSAPELEIVVLNLSGIIASSSQTIISPPPTGTWLEDEEIWTN